MTADWTGPSTRDQVCDALQAARMYTAITLAVPPALVGLSFLLVAGVVVTLGEYPYEEHLRRRGR